MVTESIRRITTHWNGPAGRNGPCDSKDGRAPGRPFNAGPLCDHELVRATCIHDEGRSGATAACWCVQALQLFPAVQHWNVARSLVLAQA